MIIHIIYVCLSVCMCVCMAAVGLRYCTWAFSGCSEQGLLFVAVRRLLIVVASRCGAQALGVRALERRHSS